MSASEVHVDVQDRITVEQAAEMAGKDRETILRWIRGGRLAASKPGRSYWVSAAALRALLDPTGASPRPSVPGGVFDDEVGLFRRRAFSLGPQRPDVVEALGDDVTDRVITIGEALELAPVKHARVTREVLQTWLRSDRLPGQRTGREYRFNMSDLLELLSPGSGRRAPVSGGVVDLDWGPFDRDPFPSPDG